MSNEPVKLTREQFEALTPEQKKAITDEVIAKAPYRTPTSLSDIPGSGYPPPRYPRWNKWRLMPDVEKWQAVALSLNIEPEKIETDRNGWMGADHPFDEGDDFNDRLEILRKNSNRTYFPTPCTLNMANWYQCEVRLDEFAAWCIHVDFEIPPELAALAKVAPQAVQMVGTAPATKDKVEPVTSPSIETWKANARQIAEQILKEKPSLNVEKIAEKTHIEMTTRKARGESGMTGRGGKVPSADTIKRHALTGIKS